MTDDSASLAALADINVRALDRLIAAERIVDYGRYLLQFLSPAIADELRELIQSYDQTRSS